MEPMLRAQVDAGRLTDCVSFRGGYLPAELPQMLAESDVYVSASKWDGTSPALLEAMSAGVYPVVTDIPANREWLIGTTDGQLIPVGNSAAMMCALVYAIQNRGVREAARPLLQDRARTQGDRATNLARLESAYQELVARHATAARRVPS
jgi:glycosyltransferase involved in cell wall biosynthesis